MKFSDVFGGLVILFLVALMIFSIFGINEVETFEIDATLTTKEFIDKPKAPNQHWFYWVDGDRSDRVEVGISTYARYAEGDLIPISVTIKEDWFGNIYENYEFGD